ncbi:hypothetical protein IAQ61_008644 [Plenodomus lingam]|uniref:Grap2 and cyclin-D-interacting-domain-containing protein n=1 Tax=Leptosphaeria maculans (strain JN3 / isolate v23.1.3 / race Av1-4-5-6-7-8) TaxID=985895 RepID=E5A7Y0_LEPMJ|nr:hypothetical protein LEMA_P073140.1 [Plenodomus lingam JN3]KAH9865908.1 hypothetical protein IAQ61_008644 [Plenodomus lingam]CBX99725.1 hypothetical protein LEMA_P073140.1 [Plenodomus lingam JN3]
MAKTKDLQTLIDLTTSAQRLFTHYQASLAPSNVTTPTSQTAESGLPNPLEAVKASVTLLKSHTTTLSLLLLTPPLTPSAVIAKLNEISSGPLSGMVAAASYTYQDGQIDPLGTIMRVEVKSQVRRLISTWGDVLALISKTAERRQATKKDVGLSESEKQEVLSATGMVWGACDTLLKLCTDGIVGLIVRKAGELRAVLLDAIEELKEWGDDIDDGSDDEATHSDDDEDDMFGSSNKLGKDDKELKDLLDASLKKLKMIGMLYQALIKRRLKTYTPSPPLAANGVKDATINPSTKLDKLMDKMKTIPETADDLASAFYDLDEDEVKQTLDKCCTAAKDAVDIVKQSWNGRDDEFTAWSTKWLDALEAS